MAEEAKPTEGTPTDSTPESKPAVVQTSVEAFAEGEAAEKKAAEDAEKQKADVAAAETVDYKAELEKKTKELEQAQFLLKEKNLADKKKRDEAAKKPTDDDDEDEEDKSKKTSEEFDQKLEEFKLAQLHDTIQTELGSMSTDADERALIDFYFRNVIKRTGDTRDAIRNDLDNARFLANKKRFEKLDQEIAAKKKSDDSKGSAGGSGGQQIDSDTQKDTGAMSDADKQLAKRYGFKPEDIKN